MRTIVVVFSLLVILFCGYTMARAGEKAAYDVAHAEVMVWQ